MISPVGTASQRDIVPMHRRDARRAADLNPVRVPEAATVRIIPAILVDLVLHATAAAAAFVALPTLPMPAQAGAAVGAYVGASLLHRVPVLWALRGTAGKLLLGLVMVRDDGKRPGLFLALAVWVRDVITTIIAIPGALAN